MTCLRGDIVLLDAPFVTRPGSKLRPMLVVQNDHNNARMANTILATITSNTSRIGEATQVLVDLATPDGNSSGLLSTSAISCENLITVRQTQIVRKLGVLPSSLMAQVDLALKAALGLT